MSRTAVLVMAHGSPDSPGEMEPYLRHVMKRRPPTPEIVALMQERYRLIGGKSPLLEVTGRQARGIAERLNARGMDAEVRVGMRHWRPFIGDVVRELAEGGVQRIVALPMTPFGGRHGSEAYLHDFDEAARGTELIPYRVTSWYGHRQVHEAWRDRIVEAADRVPSADRAQMTLLFTAHSIPAESAAGDPYADHVQAMIRGVLGLLPPVRWDFAWQSRSPGPGAWLEPDVDSKLAELHERGVRHVLVIPIGFVCDHVEVLYDVDILHRGTADRLGMDYRRTASLNDHPLLLEALAGIVRGVLAV